MASGDVRSTRADQSDPEISQPRASSSVASPPSRIIVVFPGRVIGSLGVKHALAAVLRSVVDTGVGGLNARKPERPG